MLGKNSCQSDFIRKREDFESCRRKVLPNVETVFPPGTVPALRLGTVCKLGTSRAMQSSRTKAKKTIVRILKPGFGHNFCEEPGKGNMRIEIF